MVHQVAPWPLVGLVDRRPGPPAFSRVRQPDRDLVRRPGRQRRVPQRRVLERERHRLAGGQMQAGVRGGPVHQETVRRGQQQPARAAPGGQPAGHLFQDRVDQPVFGPRGVADLDVHLPVRTGQRAQQHAGGFRAQVVSPLVAADRHRVGQHRGARRRPEGRLQHHGLVHVAAAGLELAGRPDREVPAGRVEDAGEHGGRVEPGKAQPVHRAGPAHQRGRAAVRQERVVADRQAIHDQIPSSTGRRPRAGAARLR